jgi:glycosyltransferase involved in cell wall biosynthesis
VRPLLVTWEYPPLRAGGIAAHCEGLATALAAADNDPVVLTFGDERTTEHRDGVEIHRVPVDVPAPDTAAWATRFGHELTLIASELHDEEPFDLVHGHDWMTVPAAVGVRAALDLPMVFTMHSTQAGRDGVDSPYQRGIFDLEWYGTYEADAVIAVGREFLGEVQYTYDVPREKMYHVPNGVQLDRFDDHHHPDFDRSAYAADWERLVLFVGRLYEQQGVRHLIDAMPAILDDAPDAKFVVAGSGAIDHYRGLAESRVGQKAFFPGFVSDADLVSLYRSADVVTVPSVYEPFGMVPIEAAACSTVAVGSAVGGMKDTIIHEYTGLHSVPASPASIAREVTRALSAPDWADWLGRNARKRVEERFQWRQLVGDVADVYRNAMRGV